MFKKHRQDLDLSLTFGPALYFLLSDSAVLKKLMENTVKVKLLFSLCN